ncbi:nitrite reductase large subunit NirB [uncultured Thiothrix sp.]|uniref:nitrite reductase large subunit NirB n=1 Tax=uncultured Thiothrix sp. TaxID=223185 RepID=UPI00260E76B8|nr:nitrite reductase large subunit NirB [uncultured Thiothrix sp.]
MLKQQLVLIGNGMAGVRTLEELLKLAPEHYQITVFGEEPYGNYNRIMLSPVLASEKTIEQIMLNDDDWYAANHITLHKGKRVEQINRARRQVIATDGTIAHYDRLIIATGSNPFMLPVPGANKRGVLGFRDIHHVHQMLQASSQYKKAIVIGGGLLGLEAANGLLKQGMDVSVVHINDTLMERQLDKPAAKLLQQSLEARGMKFLLQANTAEILGDERVTGVRFKDGLEVEADLVVMAVGIKPNIALAQSTGLHCERGIVVNDTMQTITDPKIYAIGECVQHRGIAYGLVAPLFEQAKVAANHLAQFGIARYQGTVTSTKLKVTGIELFSAGDFIGNDKTEEIVFKDAGVGTYKKIVLQDNQIKGAVLYGDTVDGSWYFQLMKDGTDISAFRDTLLFGQAHLGDSGHNPETRVATLADSAEICGCNGVCKGDIAKAITEKKLFTLDEVRAHTKASASCGSCTGLVESLLAHTVGGEYSATPKTKPLCKCTDFTHDEIRQGIVKYELKTMPAVRNHFEWKTPDGCAPCRNALNYYLLCAFPNEYEDDPQSRFINERAHGNIQKDGTYSVVPRMFGGLCTSQQLRDIADIADKYHVPEIKVTGGQRIDMFGIPKERLPSMWKDLSEAGFVSGHAYGKALRTVKTCVGSKWCRFGTQDSTGLGVQLEELTWGSWMPHKFKIAVSGCPRNCAEATIKDFGVVCVDSGYELHVGGNGGIKVRVTDLLCKVETEEQVKEYCGAFTQFYREDAHYLERTAPWIERVGLEKIKQAIVENAPNRQALYDRFLVSQVPAQVDPWKQIADGAHADEFAPIAIEA